MSKNDGGPAFPFAPNEQPRDNNGCYVQDWDCGDSGMTLRDWFAGQALAGLLASDVPNDRYERLISGVAARLAYEQADAMLAEREK